MGYSAKEQLSTKPTGIITFQWDSVNGETMELNGFVTPSVTDVRSFDGTGIIPYWYLNAPKIQVREANGSYSVLYYCADAYSDKGDVPGWADENGNLITTCVLHLGGGAWVSCASADCTFTTSGAVASEATAVGGYSTPTLLCGGAFPVSFKLNDTDAVTWTLTPGKSYEEGVGIIPNWYLNAPKIQVRETDGSYSVFYYCSDAWNNTASKSEPGWADENGNLDELCTVSVGGGFWLSQPNGDGEIYVTVKNPMK